MESCCRAAWPALRHSAWRILKGNKAKIVEGSIKLCWKSEAEILDSTKAQCDVTSETRATPLPVVIGTCTVDNNKAVEDFPPLAVDPKNLPDADAILVRFTPTEPVQKSQYLRLEWQLKDNATPIPSVTSPKIFKITTNAGVTGHDDDSRYKLWLYTGYSLLRSQNDFHDSYPELRLRVETRLVDERLAMKHHQQVKYEDMVNRQKRCEDTRAAAQYPPDAMTRFRDCRPWFTILRLYGESGLTSVAAQAVSDTGQPTVTKSRNAFDGSFAIGWGKTLLVTPDRPGDTDAFSVQGVLRLGLISVPAKEITDGDGTKTTIPGGTAYSYLIGPRIENESGHFEGAYFEFGVGQSDQFSLKKVPRFRADGLLPINDPGGLYRIAGRVQVDTARPFAKVKKNGLENSSQGEIRISILVNFDLKELAHRVGVPQPNTP